MKRFILLLAFILLSLFSFAQKSGELFVDATGNQYRMIQEWTLPINENGGYITGDHQGQLLTASFYYQVLRTENPDNYGNYTFFLYFYSNATGYDSNRNVVPKDVIIKNLLVEENNLESKRIVYETPIYLIDRSGTKIVSWLSNWKNAGVNFYYSDSYLKQHYEKKELKRYSNKGGY